MAGVALRRPVAGRFTLRLVRWVGWFLLLSCGWSASAEGTDPAGTDAPPCDLVVVAHADNPVPTLTPLQVKQLFLGRLRLFPDTRLEVLLLDLPHDSPVFAWFYNRYTDMDVVRLSRYRSRYLFSGQGRLPESLPDAAAVRERLAEQPGALGYLCHADWRSPLRILYPQPASDSEP